MIGIYETRDAYTIMMIVKGASLYCVLLTTTAARLAFYRRTGLGCLISGFYVVYG